jgi:hypothetical protein
MLNKPTKKYPKDKKHKNQKQAIKQFNAKSMVEVTGLEPATYCLQSSRSPS